jgi:hypothetical protein
MSFPHHSLKQCFSTGCLHIQYTVPSTTKDFTLGVSWPLFIITTTGKLLSSNRFFYIDLIAVFKVKRVSYL